VGLYIEKLGYFVVWAFFGLIALICGAWAAVKLLDLGLHWLKTKQWIHYSTGQALNDFGLPVSSSEWLGVQSIMGYLVDLPAWIPLVLIAAACSGLNSWANGEMSKLDREIARYKQDRQQRGDRP